ncbi:MAG: hypothetical protein KJS92_00530 [Bacteroidetes bacterium]|nr:hypothetical protein [Bacteroidota bacterium]
MLFFLCLKFIYILLGLLWQGNNDWLSVFHRNDSSWYALIAENGYPTVPPQPGTESEFAFFPLYPALVSIFMPLLGTFHQAAFAFSLLTGLLLITLCFRLLRQLEWSDREIFRFLALYQLLPFHHFHHVFYSEQLFLLILAGIMLSLEQRSTALLFALSALLALTRPTGLIYAATLPLLYLPNFNVPAFIDWVRRCWPLMGAPFGIFLWTGYLKLHCGDALAFSHAQSGWNRKYCWPWESLFNDGNTAIILISIYAVLILITALTMFRRSGFGVILFHGINLLFPLSTGQVISYPRYTSANLPLFLRLRSFLEAPYFPWILALAATLHLFIYYAWVMNLPIWSY